MTVSQSRELRRARKLRAWRLLSGARTPEPRTALDAESLEQARRAWREWGGQTHALLDPPFVRR